MASSRRAPSRSTQGKKADFQGTSSTMIRRLVRHSMYHTRCECATCLDICRRWWPTVKVTRRRTKRHSFRPKGSQCATQLAHSQHTRAIASRLRRQSRYEQSTAMQRVCRPWKSPTSRCLAQIQALRQERFGQRRATYCELRCSHNRVAAQKLLRVAATSMNSSTAFSVRVAEGAWDSKKSPRTRGLPLQWR